jgi:hypothetical protein
VRSLAFIAVVAVAVLVPPFVVRGIGVVMGETAGWRELLLIAHVTTAGVAILLGTLQLIPRIRRRKWLHRRIGRAFLAVGAVAFVGTGLPLALTVENQIARAGLLVPVMLWPVFAAAGFLAIRRHDVARHRAWMARLYALSFFAISARLIVPVLMLMQLPMLDAWYDGDVQRMAEASIPFGQWLGWILNLAVVELILRRNSLAWQHASGPPRDRTRPSSRTGVA